MVLFVRRESARLWSPDREHRRTLAWKGGYESRARSFRQRHGRSKASKIKMIDNQNSTRGTGCCRILMSLLMFVRISFGGSVIMEAQANRRPQHLRLP